MKTRGWLCAVVLGLAGCDSAPDTAAEFIGSGGAADTSCAPLTEHQGCNGRDRMLCEQTSATWQTMAECGSTEQCKESDDPGLPGAKLTACVELPRPGETPPSTPNVCERWAQDREDMAEGDWDGSAPQCKPGILEPRARAQTTRLVNLYRDLAGLPPVTDSDALSANAQACAVMMRANGKISHTPAQTWKCWTEQGALAAKKSNLSTAGAVKSVDRYIIDSGAHNQPTLGHRRWILNTSLEEIGTGSAGSKFSCLWVIGGKAKTQAPWVAWPPAGEVPSQALAPYGTSIDSTGWSLQSDTIPLNKGTVSVSSEGQPLTVDQRTLKANYGSKYAIAWRPVGWKTSPGKSYTVTVNGLSEPLSYNVTVVDCGDGP